MSRFRTEVPAWLPAGALALALAAGPAAGHMPEDVAIVDGPTPGVLPHGGYLLFGSIGPESDMLFAFKLGFFDRLMLGASFGLQRFIGRGDINVNDRLGFEARVRVIEESEAGPAIALGIDTQGREAFIESSDRYERKSKGVYAVVGKNYRLIDDFTVNAGVNYSLENRDESGVDVFGGFALGVGKGLSLLLEYDPALNDSDAKVPSRLTRARGYLDAGVRLDYRDNLRFKVLFKDLLGNFIPETGVSRSVEVFYVNSF
jgi:hypothetical protein